MERMDAMAWTVDRPGLGRKSPALSGLKPRTELVAAALGMVRSSLAELGRCLPGRRGVAARHSFAKLWCSNSKPRSCSFFTIIGRTLPDRLKLISFEP